MADKRSFTRSVSIRIDKRRIKIELANAAQYGGPDGLYRLRVDRRWHDGPEGQQLYMGRNELAEFLATYVYNEEIRQLQDMPVLQRGTRVTVRYSYRGDTTQTGTYTSTPPIRGYDGQTYVGVMTPDAGWVWVPMTDVHVPGKGNWNAEK